MALRLKRGPPHYAYASQAEGCGAGSQNRNNAIFTPMTHSYKVVRISYRDICYHLSVGSCRSGVARPACLGYNCTYVIQRQQKKQKKASSTYFVLTAVRLTRTAVHLRRENKQLEHRTNALAGLSPVMAVGELSAPLLGWWW